MCSAVTSVSDSEVFRLELELMPSTAICGDLAALAAGAETYRWRQGGATGSFAQLLELREGRLSCWLMSPRVMAGWPQGDELVWQVTGYLLRLSRMLEDSDAA